MTVPLVGMSIDSAAQERAGLPVNGSYPYAQAVLAAPKSAGAERAPKNLSAPVLNAITPEASAPPSLVLPERRTAIDQMLQSHEFTFGAKPKPSAFAAKNPAVGTNMDLDAIKLRVSRDKVMIKAEWKFN